MEGHENTYAQSQYITDELREALRPPTGPHIIPVDLFVYVIGRAAAEDNPLLSNLLLSKLEEMTPQTFLAYVMEELSIEEQRSIMLSERLRRKTFTAQWPHQRLNSSLSGNNMAQAGLFYLGNTDTVRCAFCNGSLHDWSEGEEPMREHSRLFNFCTFARGGETANKPIRRHEDRTGRVTDADLTNITRHSGNEAADSSCLASSLGIRTQPAARLELAPYQARLSTFRGWPEDSPLSAESLCEAGFYMYVGLETDTRCFSCGGIASYWKESDDPWTEHARWFPECVYLIEKKGEQFVQDAYNNCPAYKRGPKKKQWVNPKEQLNKMQTWMIEICTKLGHTRKAIDKAIACNKRPFENEKQMIDAVYEIEDEGELSSEEIADQSRHTIVSQQPLTEEMMCIMCQAKKQSVQASNIGLPCGHLIFCDSCAQKAVTDATGSTNGVTCPYYLCSEQLNGTMKVFFA